MVESVLPDDERCTARIAAGVRCARRAEADGYCVQHHPLLKKEREEEKRVAIEAQRRTARIREWFRIGGLKDFWAQVAICALLEYLTKASPGYADALMRRLERLG
jgi:hypothetical protein